MEEDNTLICPNCRTELLPYAIYERDDGFYCPNVDCEYATVYDDRLAFARNNYKWGMNTNGFEFIDYKTDIPDDVIHINTSNNLNTISIDRDNNGIQTVDEKIQIKNYELKLDNIIGYDDIKDRLRDIINATKPVHFLMIGSPSVAKTVFLESIEAETTPQGLSCSYIDCSTLTKAGLGEYIEKYKMNLENGIMLADEIDSIDKYDQKALLNLLARGVWQVTNSKKMLNIKVKNMRVIATCNKIDKLIEALRSRFMVVYMKAYTREEYIEICILMLQKKYTYLTEELAKYIAEQTATLKPRYVRNADRVAILCKARPSFSYIDKIISTMDKYKIPDEIERYLDQQT